MIASKNEQNNEDYKKIEMPKTWEANKQRS